MDVKREKKPYTRIVRLLLLTIVVTLIVGGGTFLSSNLRTATPVVSSATSLIAVVQRGDMIREVSGNGVLVPAEVHLISPSVSGRIEQVLVRPGEAVSPDTVLIELSNPDLERNVLDATYELEVAEAELRELQIQLNEQSLDLEESLIVVSGKLAQARLVNVRDKQLFEEGLLPRYDLDVSSATLDSIESQYKIIQQRIAMRPKNGEVQTSKQQSHIEQLKSILAHQQEMRDALKVRAGTNGVLQQLMIEKGQPVTTTTTLAKIANTSELKAELNIPGVQLRDVEVGQPVSLDTRNGVVNGCVMRIDPSVVGETVTVEIVLTGPLPKVARPDLRIEGTIQLQQLRGVLFVQKPVGCRENSTLSLFKIVKGTNQLVRTDVKLGSLSVNAAEVVSGLDEGEKVIISDMSDWEEFDMLLLD